MLTKNVMYSFGWRRGCVQQGSVGGDTVEFSSSPPKKNCKSRTWSPGSCNLTGPRSFHHCRQFSYHPIIPKADHLSPISRKAFSHLETIICECESIQPPAGRLYWCMLLLLSNKQEDRRAKGEEAHQPWHGCRGRNEGSQPCKQEVDNHTPGGNTFGHVHFESPFGRLC